MNEDFEALQNRHLRLLEEVKKRPKAKESLKEVEDFIASCREAGRHVSDPTERDRLRAFIRYWAAFVYEQTREFPRTQLEPLAIEAAPMPSVERPAAAPAEPWYARGSLWAVLGAAILLLGLLGIGGYVIFFSRARRGAEQVAVAQTAAAATAQAQATAEAASETPVPTFTPVPTYTPYPTYTPVPTDTPVPPRPTPMLLPYMTTAPLAYGPIYHSVGYGETLASIARSYGVSSYAIARANDLANPNYIYAGQTLIIPQGGGITPPLGGGRTHVVQSGENLFRIALRYGTTPQAIAAANNLPNIHLIYAGQVLRIP